MISAVTQNSCLEVEKAQWIRWADILFIAPLMIYAGTVIKNKNLKILLIVMGILTLLYNAGNLFATYNINKNG